MADAYARNRTYFGTSRCNPVRDTRRDSEDSKLVGTETNDDHTVFVISCPDHSNDDTISRLPDYDHLYPNDIKRNHVLSLNNNPEQTSDDKTENDCDMYNEDNLLEDDTIVLEPMTLLQSQESRRKFTHLVEVEQVVDLGFNVTPSNCFNHLNQTPSTQVTSGIDFQVVNIDSVLPRFYDKDSKMTQSQRMLLLQEGFPLGLLEQLEHSRFLFPVRYWLIDNSGSMRSSDGHQIQTVNKSIKTRLKSTTVIAKCSRWEELQTTISDHAELAGLLELPTIFRFLNVPDIEGGRQEHSVAYSTLHNGLDYNYEDVNEIKQIVQKNTPKGATPLTCHLVEFGRRIQAIQQVLQEHDRAAVVVVVTDGIPTDNDGNPSTLAQKAFLESIRSLNALGASVVIRLCTADEDVVSYFHDLEKDVDMRVDVLSDFLSESRQVNRHNSWLNYTLPLHRCRELGLHHRLFDVLDERLLTKDEFLEFLKLLFGMNQFKNAPDIHTQWTKFKVHLKRVVEGEKKHWSPITNKMKYWIRMSSLDRFYGTSRQYPWQGGEIKSFLLQYKNAFDDVQQNVLCYFSTNSYHSSSPPQYIDERLDVQRVRETIQ